METPTYAEPLTDPIEPAEYLDSREIITRIHDLEEIAQAHAEDPAEPPLSPDDADELAALKALEAEAESYAADWTYGETLIREDAFKNYARELASDLGALGGARWPVNHIDWTAAAAELQQDYTEVNYRGWTYLVR